MRLRDAASPPVASVAQIRTFSMPARIKSHKNLVIDKNHRAGCTTPISDRHVQQNVSTTTIIAILIASHQPDAQPKV